MALRRSGVRVPSAPPEGSTQAPFVSGEGGLCHLQEPLKAHREAKRDRLDRGRLCERIAPAGVAEWTR